MKNDTVKKFSFAIFRNVIAMGLVSFFTDISSEMCFALLPTFVLGLPGGTRALLGILEGLAQAVSYGIRAISGVFSDRIRKRKVIIFIGYALSSVVKPFWFAASTALESLYVRVVDRVGKGIRTSPRDALLSESVPEEHWGFSFGLHRTMDQVGAIAGPFLGATLLFFGFTIRKIFLFSAIPGAIAVIVIIFLVKERQITPFDSGWSPDVSRGGIRSLFEGRLPLYLLFAGIFSVGAFNIAFIQVRAMDAGMSGEIVSLVFGVAALSHTLLAIPAGLLGDKIGKVKVLIFGYGLFFVSVLLFLTPFVAPAFIFFLAAVYGAYQGIGETIEKAFVPSFAPKELRATAYGTYYLVEGGAYFISNAVFGMLWEYVDVTTACSFSLIMSAIGIIGMIVFFRKGK